MSAKSSSQENRKWRVLRIARRVSQTVFLLLFIWLIGVTVSVTGSALDAASSTSIPYPVEAFLDIDPLAGAIAFLSTGTVPGSMIYGLITLISAILLGRVFCSWVCPMGTMNHLASEIKPRIRGKRRIDANRTRPYQKIKYVVLFAVLVAALFGSAVGGLLDPICLATRGISLTFLPWVQWALGSALTAAGESDLPAAWQAADKIYDSVGGVLLNKKGVIVAGGFFVSLFFLAALVANRIIPRFWCRGICPLGALLGLFGRFGILTLKKDQESCNECGKCQLHCAQAASPKPGEKWQRAECDLCMNCTADCPKDSLAFGLFTKESAEQSLPDLKRRSVLVGAASGAALVPTMRAGALGSLSGRPDPACIRPPGSLGERGFLERCIRCGQCMKICPNNALHPAFDEAGIEGLWTPVLVPRIGYCEPTCTLCTQVCPTGAIHSVTENQKVGQGGEGMIRLGTAFIDRGRCLPWAMDTPCIVCEEFCPVSPKAIWFSKEELVTRDGKTITLKAPHVDPTACNGCGACEYVCPVNDKAAIRITSVGESRSPGHELLLHRPKKKDQDGSSGH
jgi:polyferredoxin